MPVAWPDEVDGIITGDLTAGLAYVTPAGGAVVTAVAPVGLRDRDLGTVGFTTSLGLGKKLERIRRNPRIALTYHSREHGLSQSPRYVLVQGKVVSITKPDIAYLTDVLTPQVKPYLGAPRRGVFWDRWLQEYYQDRVLITVEVERLIVWPDAECSGEPEVLGAPLPGPPRSQDPPAKGTGPRLNSARLARRLAARSHRLLAYVQADGYPAVLPIDVTAQSAAGVALRQPGSAGLPPGGRRAGLLGHAYGPQLTGLRTRQSTGWLEVGQDGETALFAPHTEKGFAAPSNKTLLLLVNGMAAKVGLAQARRARRADLLDGT